jgi:Cytidylate kinase-like family
MIRIITISREYGSGGGEIARILGGRLGWRLIDDSLIAEISKRIHHSPEAIRSHEESVDPWFHRILKALWRGGFMGAATRAEEEACDAEATARLWHRVILEAAEAGECVAVGRGAQCLLQKRADAFHVHVYAPMRERLRRLERREPAGVDLTAAARERDARRAAYISHYFDHDWKDTHLYHLMLCSSIGLERAADAVLCASGIPEWR